MLSSFPPLVPVPAGSTSAGPPAPGDAGDGQCDAGHAPQGRADAPAGAAVRGSRAGRGESSRPQELFQDKGSENMLILAASVLAVKFWLLMFNFGCACVFKCVLGIFLAYLIVF